MDQKTVEKLEKKIEETITEILRVKQNQHRNFLRVKQKDIACRVCFRNSV